MRWIFQILLRFVFISPCFAQPAPRHLEELTFDDNRGKLLLFGGVEFDNGNWKEPTNVCEWDEKSWQNKNITGPPGRRGHAWVFDKKEAMAVAFGGVMQGAGAKDSMVFDMWTWDGHDWKKLNTTCPVKEPKAVYDPLNSRILVYGKEANELHPADNKNESAFGLWQFNLNAWHKLSPDGQVPGNSGPIAFDEARRVLVMPVFENGQLNVFEWKESKWNKIPCSGDCPSERSRFAFAYDKTEKQVFLFGGLSKSRELLGDFWKWNGQKWQRIVTIDGPSARNSSHLVTGKDQLFLFGGSKLSAEPGKGIAPCNELWTWQNGNWKKLN